MLSNSSGQHPELRGCTRNAVEQAAEHLRELRVAEAIDKDMVIRDAKGRGLPMQVWGGFVVTVSADGTKQTCSMR